MKIELIVNPELKKHIPPLKPYEYQALEQSIINEGCRDDIIIWYNKADEPEKMYCQNCCQEVIPKLSDGSYQCSVCDATISIAKYTIVDGHNRNEICQRHDIEFKTEIHEFDNIEDVKDWIDENQLGRRNLTDDQRRLIIGKRYNREKKQGVRTDLTSGQNVQKLTTAKKIAKENKVNEKTVRRCGQLATEFEHMEVEKPELAKEIFEGYKTFKDIKQEEKLRKLACKKIEYIEQGKAGMTGAPEVYSMSCQDYLLTFKDDSIDLLFTDPPYSTDIPDIKAFTQSWLPLAIQKTKKTGRMLIFSGAYPKEIHAFLDVLLAQDKFIVDNPLIWTYKNTLGVTPKMKYNLNYQLIWHLYSNESTPLNTSITSEMFSIQEDNAPDGRIGNRLHSWQKSDDLAERLVRHTTKLKDTIVDTFTCTGTFIIAANKLGRVGKGCDIDQENLNIAISRGCKLININTETTIVDQSVNSTSKCSDESTSTTNNLIQDAPTDKPDEDTDGLLELDGDIETVD
jgi:DNA modification methylase